MRIWKFPLKVVDEQLVYMPAGATILTVQVQRDVLCVWAECDENFVCTLGRWFSIFGTGNPILDGYEGRYISTFQLEDGMLVFHLYENMQ